VFDTVGAVFQRLGPILHQFVGSELFLPAFSFDTAAGAALSDAEGFACGALHAAMAASSAPAKMKRCLGCMLPPIYWSSLVLGHVMSAWSRMVVGYAALDVR